ncbi:GYDIA family GHMP kinase [Seonamhaeicola aphaedonensis]|uniref:Mevalonate kinase n=1 Tax=Seonamhaeicola aphaedonensis TaxID=1461338 RepID=A0A3D9HL53_9FLAO|nr:GYDIA family GHMP kinase [Seonamhaeicola aphaedonensis]RED50198.1 mevalonate kinase [Seonamhaeicola aphaedonensis]
MQNFYSNGKLLITGEYVVLDGAISLAVPTKFGQSLKIESIPESILHWKSIDENGNIWFENQFEWHGEILKQAQNDDISKRLLQIFKAVKKINPSFLNAGEGYNISTVLDFPKNWGLGTSSTLINNIAQWANIDAFKLLEETFKGSGYDIACSQNNTPITYKLDYKTPIINQVSFKPSFEEHLYFIHLNKKQNSREGIAHYRAQDKVNINETIKEVNNITLKMITCDSFEEFKRLMNQHENIISDFTNQKTVKELLFNDFDGSLKSLGAWGGDFVLAASDQNPTIYFKSKGYETIISYADMIL